MRALDQCQAREGWVSAWKAACAPRSHELAAPNGYCTVNNVVMRHLRRLKFKIRPRPDRASRLQRRASEWSAWLTGTRKRTRPNIGLSLEPARQKRLLLIARVPTPSTVTVSPQHDFVCKEALEESHNVFSHLVRSLVLGEVLIAVGEMAVCESRQTHRALAVVVGYLDRSDIWMAGRENDRRCRRANDLKRALRKTSL